MRPIVLLSDFGSSDHYVGVLHAVLERDAPGVARIDLGHNVAAGDIWQACYLLRCSWPHLPPQAVVLAVVDPGVGTERRAVALRIGDRRLVAPDNGLAGTIGPADEVVLLDRRRMELPEPSRTFHGRDLFAPASARLARGDALGSLGEAVAPDLLAPDPLPDPERTNDGWRATVWHVDRFGNLVTNLPAGYVPPTAVVARGDGGRARRVETFAQGAAGEVVILEGSSGLLELVVNGGSAAEATGLGRGDVVEVVERS
jgi:S-adenosylmethionine hydrolase